ncbi:Hsp70 family protein [Natrarchaeobius oligotrophus]|uniref:Molecular chaperone DnaK n=1 Tax=Natrarchaeobius chitinivorans TaxID=1679083 RepID=A0A3N6PHI9_NATCH|nr:Hsp70 family protein [Natrarchaeobius chitinivorans]RQH00090.1 molecular chaperone DnaK [Natrarchaeobius chitinivorans]
MAHSVGIDLGTTSSAVARIVGTDPVVLTAETGERTVPSVVGFDEDGEEVYVGRTAVNFETQHPERVINSVKRRMGEQDPVAYVNGEEYLPEEISALILKKLKQTAEDQLGSRVTNAVITVPAYFGNEQREATKRAGRIAGLTVDRIINEPTAAMLAHGIDRDDETTALVYDLGGGTFDVSIVKATAGIFEVVATDGLRHHGGDDWDDRLVAQMQRIIAEETGQSVAEDPQKIQRLWKAAREAKHELTHREKTTIRIPFIVDDWNFEKTITREQFEGMTEDLLDPTVATCHDVLEESGVDADDLDVVLLVGGSTRMPQVGTRLKEAFGDVVRRSESPDEVVAKGAAVQAGLLSDSLPAVREEGSEALQRQEETALETTDDSYDLPTVYDDAVLIDVTSKSLGTKLKGDNFAKVIRKNASIPAEQTERFVTTEDDQTIIRVGVYQGESMTASENALLGEFVLSGLPRLPAGEAKVDVTFRINADGILEVTAESVQKGHSDGITIESGVEYSERNIETMRSGLPVVK